MPKLNIKVYRNLMGANDRWAARTRALLKKHQVIMLDLIGSPGAALGIFLLAVGVTSAAMTFESPIAGSNKVDWFIIDFLDHGDGTSPVDYMGGQCTYPTHPGIDFMLYDNLTRDVGIDVLAAAEGFVIIAIDGLDDRGTNAPGNVVWLQHADDSYSYYAHLKRNSMLVSSGQVVTVGQKLAEVGAFKADDVAHLHFGVYSSDRIAREIMTNELGLSQHFDWFDSYSNQVIRQVVSMGITKTNDQLVAPRQWTIEWQQQTPRNYSVMTSGSFCVWLKYLGFGTTDVLCTRLLPVSGPAGIIDFSACAWSVETYTRVSRAQWYSDWIGVALSNGVAYRLQYRWNNENWRDAPGSNNLVVVDDDRCEVFLSRYCSGTFEAPCMPTALTTSAGTYTNKVRLIWEPSTAAINYRVLRSVTNDAATAMQIAVTGNTAYDDTNAVAYTTYYYWVQAVNAVGDSDFSTGDSGFSASNSINDYDGDGKSDLAVYRDGYWSISLMSGSVLFDNEGVWGGAGWTTVPGDYDGDGKADLAVYRDGYWSIFTMAGNVLFYNEGVWGGSGWTTVPGDYDGDGKSDLAVYRDGYWSIFTMVGNVLFYNEGVWGGSGWTTVPGDYDGDGKSDLAVYRDGYWSIFTMAGNVLLYNDGGYGGSGWTPVSGDYDGDGKYDRAIYRDGEWYIYSVTGNLIRYAVCGGAGWTPVK